MQRASRRGQALAHATEVIEGIRLPVLADFVVKVGTRTARDD